MIKIGLNLTHLIDKKEPTVLNIYGSMNIKGNIIIGNGARIAVSKNASLLIGSNLNSTGRLYIACENNISIGDDCMLSWNILLMDTDYHPIFIDHKNINPSKPIQIGDHVWIGANSTILKGVKIGNNIIIASGSMIKRSVSCNNSIYGPTSDYIQILRQGIMWDKQTLFQ